MSPASAQKAKDFYLISEVASILKVSTHTIRNLENEFGIEVKKDSTGKRVYTFNDIEKYKLIIERKNSFDVSSKFKPVVNETKEISTELVSKNISSDFKLAVSQNYSPEVTEKIHLFSYIVPNFYSLFDLSKLSKFSLTTFIVATLASFGSFFFDSYMDIDSSLSQFLGVNSKQVSNVLQATDENWDYRFDVNVPAFFNNSLVGSSAAFDLITVGDRVIINPNGISAPNIINTVQTLPNEEVLLVDITDVNNPVFSITNNPVFDSIDVGTLNGVTELDDTTIQTIEDSINIPTASTDAQTFGGLSVADFLRSNTNTTFTNGIMTFDASSSLKFNNINPNTFLKVDESNNLVGFSILPGINVDFTSTANSLTINVSTNPIATQNYSSIAVNTLFLGTSSFDPSYVVLSSAEELNKLFTLSGSLLTTTNLSSQFPLVDYDSTNDITTANLSASIFAAFPNIDTNSTNDVLISSLASLMLTNYVNLDTDATNDITTSNFSSTLFSLFPNIDTNAANDVDLLQDAVLIGSNAGKNVYSENIWFGYQDFNRASASIFEVESNGKISFNGGVLPAITDNAFYSYDDVLYFQEAPLAVLSNHNVNTHNNRFAIFSTNAAGKLQLSGSTNVGLSYIQSGASSSILGMDGNTLRYLNVTGDLSVSTTSSSNITFTFNNVNSSTGTFGSETAIPQITVNSKGLITGVATIPFSSITNPNNYVTAISFSVPAVTQRTLVLQRQGLTDLTAMFSISGSDITTALGYTPLRNTTDTLTGNLGVTGTFSAATGSFTNLSSQNANISNLTLANALSVIYGGTGNIDTPQAGQLLIGNGTGYTLSSLTAGTNITISTGAGSITISAVAGGSNANNYVNAISFSDASSTTKTLVLSREGLSNLTASFSISAANVTSALGYTPFNAANFTSTQIINTLGYTPLNSTAFNAVNITNALGYVPFGPSNFIAGTNISLSSTATSLTINSSFTDTTNPNNYVTGISFSDATASIKTLTLTREGLANLTASFSLSSSDITSALGFTPLRNTSDTLSGNLTITGTLSAATVFQGGNQVCDYSGNCAGLGGGIIGSGNAGFISLFTATNSIANSSIYQSLANGYIGIGTTNPGELLDVYGAIKLSQNMGTEARGNALYQDNGVLYWNGQAVGVVGSTAPGGISGTKDYIPFFNTKDTLIASEIYYESGTTERSIELIANTVIPTYLGIGHKNQYNLKLGVAANTNAFYTVYDSEDDVALVNTANLSTADMLFALENTAGKILFMFGKNNNQTAPFTMTYNSGTHQGRFGINTTNPTYNLEVIGSAKITDTLAARIFSNPNSNNFVFLSGGNFNGNLSAGSANLTGLTLASALGVAYGGTGLTATPNAGQLLIGNGAGFTLSALTAGSNVTISTTAGGITISSSYIDTTNPNNYVTGVSFIDSGATYKLFTLDREGLSSLTAVFSISASDVTSALGFIPQINLGYTPLDSNAFNAVNITNALGYIPFGASNFVAGNNVSISTTATSITISSTDTTNPNNFVSAISFSAPASAQRVLNLSRTGLATLTADFTFNQSDIITALGYTPLSNSTDFMTGSLGVATSFSAATGSFTNLTLANALGVIYGGTGITGTPNLGQLLIGNGTGYTLSGLTAGTGISISTGAGSITVNSTIVDTNNYVTDISFSDASATIKTLSLTQNGLSNLVASFSISSANVTSALGFTPVNRAGDTMSGSLTILQTLSAQDVVVLDNLFVGDYANSAYTLQIEPKLGTLARKIVLDLTSGSQTETTLGMFIQSIKFSAPSAAELKNLTFNQISATNDLILDILKAGTLPAVSNGVLDTYNSQVSAASLYLAANTTNTPQIRFMSSAGVNLNSPAAGDLWWNGSNLYFNDGTSNIDIIDNVSDVLLGATVYSTTATAVANGGYIELVHNQNSNDILADAWIYNSTTSKWEKFYADSEGNQVIDLMEYSSSNDARAAYSSPDDTAYLATGGVVTYTDQNGLNPRSDTPYIGGFVVHTFTAPASGTATQTLVVNTFLTNASYLVVGGGGAGGNGGGGAGDVFSAANSATFSQGTYTISVYTGALGYATYSSPAPSRAGSGGSNTILSGPAGFTTIEAGGGCGGAHFSINSASGCTGNGGGAGAGGGVSSSGASPNLPGGLGVAGSGTGGGGAGMGTAGGNATASSGGVGGNGVASSISGLAVTYAAGGGGGGFSNASVNYTGGAGGSSGIGGRGGNGSNTLPPTNGSTPGSGGGAGGITNTIGWASGSGGPGIVIVRYAYVPPTINLASGGAVTYTDENGLNPRSGTPYESGYVVHTFTGAGNATFVANQAMNIEYLAVGGGGGGGEAMGGGGGGGQLLTNASNVVAGNYTITVGAGGTSFQGSASPWNAGLLGGASIISGPSFTTVTAYGGGGGAGYNENAATAFGNGGGDSAQLYTGAAPGLGLNRGGFGKWQDYGGGGGGAGLPGISAAGTCAGAGGIGAVSSITGNPTYYAGGGGGGNRGNVTNLCDNPNATNGGLGGGGKGGDATNNYVGVDGQDNTGGGGGASGYKETSTPYSNPGDGGSGIVVIRYKYSNLQRSTASDIFAQGTRSLKIDAVATSSLYKELRRTVSPTINLSNQNKITFSMRASRTGQNIKIGLRDSGGTVSEITPNITTTSTFQDFTWDISSIANANKDSIDQIIITVVNADAANTVYLDGIVSENQYKIYQVDANTVRLYNYSGTTQDMKLTVNVESQLSLATASVIGKTGTFDTLVADLFTGALGQLNKLNIGNVLTSNAALNIRAATADSAQINLASSNGLNVTNPNEGDLWWNGTSLMFNDGSQNLDLLAAVASVQNIYLGNIVYSGANSTLANGNYIEVSHNRTTYDVIATGWIFNTETSKWEQFNGTQESQTTLDLMEYSTDTAVRTAYTASGTAVTAAGGAITYTDSNGLNPSNTPYVDGYVVHTFTGAGYHNLNNVPAGTSIDYLVVGGGGGGGEYRGGGGGGGTFETNASPLTLFGGNYTLYVGKGGDSYTGSASPWESGDSGQGSFISGPSLTTIQAYGGAGGAGLAAASASFGNGGGDNQNGATNYPGGAQGAGQNDGGAALPNPGGAGGGGGGAGAVGGSAVGYCAGNGGIGRASSISGTSTYYAGGGGGGLLSSAVNPSYVCATATAGDGGLGGGGNGGDSTNSFVGQDAVANTGGGGGGAGYQTVVAPNSNAGDGADGIIIIRYPYTATSLQRYTESTIKDQGTYSLKGVAAITASLNQSISKTFSPALNLSNQNKIFFSMRASRTGQNIKVSIVDAGGTESFITPNITVANVFQDFEWDISSIANTDKDSISNLKFTVVDADAANTFYVDNFRTVNSYKITLVDADTVRLYNYSGTTQNMRLVVAIQSPDSLLSAQLGYQPLANSTDYMRGNLGVTGSFSAASAQFPDLFTTRFSASTANVTDLFATNFSGTSGFMTNFGVTSNFSAASGLFTNINATNFSGTSGFMTNFGVTSNFSAASGLFTNLNATNFSGTSGFMTNFGVTSALSAATATFRGTVTVSNPSGGTQLNLVSNGGSGNNIELGFYDGATKRANFSMDSTSTFEFEGASGTNVHFNATNGAYRFWKDGVNKFAVENDGNVYVGRGSASTDSNLSTYIPFDQALSITNYGKTRGLLFNMQQSNAAANLRNYGIGVVDDNTIRFMMIGDTYQAAYSYLESTRSTLAGGTPISTTTTLNAYNGISLNVRGQTALSADNEGVIIDSATYDPIRIGFATNNAAAINRYSEVAGRGYFDIVSNFGAAGYGIRLGVGANVGGWQTVLHIESNAALNIGGVNSTAVTDDRTLCTASTNLRLEIKNGACGTSSLRYKENIATLPYGLAEIMQLNPVSYNYKNFTEENAGGRTKERIGFIAEEMNEIIPEVVLKEDGVVDSIEYKDLVPLAIKGIQEQQVQITSLSNAVAGINLASMQSIYEQFTTTLENLSMSTENGALVVNTNLTVTGEALFNNATFTGDVAIGQIKFDSLNNDISINGMNCTNIDGTLNTALCETQTLFVMKNKAGNLNFFDGKVVINPLGEMTVEKITAGEVAAAKVKASEYQVVAGSEVSGNTQILSGQTEITILTSKVKANSKVFVTANGDLGGRSLYVSDKVEGVSFKVKLNQALSSDVNFDWFILNSE